MKGWVKMHYSLLKWEWYTDKNAKIVFLHCLLRANWKKTNWRGQKLNIGEFATSLQNLALEVGLTKQEVRTALNKLKSTREITVKGKSKYSIIKVNKYDDYQEVKESDNSNKDTPNLPVEDDIATRKQHANNIQSTNNQHSINIQSTTEKEVKTLRSKTIEGHPQKKFRKPTELQVYQRFIYLKLKPDNAKLEAEKFMAHYESNGWKIGGVQMDNWKAAVKSWETKIENYKRNYGDNKNGQQKRVSSREEITGGNFEYREYS